MAARHLLAPLALVLLSGTSLAQTTAPVFNRISAFPVVSNLPAGIGAKVKTNAEIVTATADGRRLVYTNSDRNALGFVDISDPAAPRGTGEVDLGGEPTSATIVGTKAYVVVSTSQDKAKPDGYVAEVDLASQTIGTRCALGGQADSIARSPDGTLLAIAVENERDEKLNKGKLPQLPAGDLRLVRLGPAGLDCAAIKTIAVTGLAEIAPEDPEPEFVDINAANEVVLTLQENNHIVIVDGNTGEVKRHFPAGSADIDKIDTKRDGIIALNGSLKGVKREPDAVKWLDGNRFVTANEGDYEGGSRSFTIFNRDGTVAWDSGNLLEHLAVRLGHFPERRAGAKGTEPEGVEVARFGNDTLIFIGLERANLVAVFRDRGADQAPEYLQALPTGVGPEGLVAIPAAGLLAVANEVDDPETGNRSTVTLYRLEPGKAAAYPTIQSTDGPDGLPIGWGALSGLTPHPTDAGKLLAVSDSFFARGSIYTIDATATPARIIASTVVTLDGKPAEDLDLEAIAARPAGGFWLASEGNPERKEKPTENLLLRASETGAIEEVITLPDALKAGATRFGFEGVTVTGSGADETVWLAVQREWADDPKGHTKLLRYRPATKDWAVLHYPLDAAGPSGWVGVSEIVATAPDRLIVLERDNQMGEAARTKRLYSVSLAGLSPAPLGQTPPVVQKQLLRDLLPDLKASRGAVLEKIEGFTVMRDGTAVAVTDNDGVDGASGETQFLRLGKLP